MNQKFNFIYLSFLAIGLGAISLSTSTGRTDNRTAHPLDISTCRACHTGGELNRAGGSVELIGLPTTIMPNTSYPLTIAINDADALVGGFQLLACSGTASNTNIGTFSTTASVTKLASAPNGRLIHAAKRNFSSGQVSWSFTWTSPASPPENTTFYFAGNAADNGGTRLGVDDIYTGNSSSIVLGVEFAELKAETKANNEVTLTWATLTEQNNSHFVVERSMGEKTAFEAIGEIKGAGNSTNKKVYIFNDFTTKSNDFTAEYRIKQVDNDGKASFSKILSAAALNLKNKAKVYPTLLQRGQNIQIEQKGSFSVYIFDAAGGLISTLQNQENNAQIGSENLAKGTYFLKIQSKNSSETKKIILQ